MIDIVDKHHCSGCETCIQACPQQCMFFEEDTEGFSYPMVDKANCIDCGLCEKVCPVLNQADERMPLKVYAAKNRDEQELLNSSSGGIFILLAKAVIKKSGVVFGARFDDNWNVVHAYAETEESVKAFMGSKYVQSRIGNTYKEAKAFLDEGRQVLFSGTSCQIAGLQHFLRKEYDNLLTVDVICHGVPSPKVWRMYLDEMKRNACKGGNSVLSPLTHRFSKRENIGGAMQIKSISFRDKRLDWKKYCFTLTLAEDAADGKQNTASLSHIHKEDPFMKVFLQNINLRPSCYHCPAKGGRSRSDVTIGDFWGIENVLPSVDYNHGVGLMMINTLRGEEFADLLDMDITSVAFEDAIKGNPAYSKAVLPHRNRDKFFRKVESSSSIIRLMVTLTCPSVRIRIRYFLSKLKNRLLKS